jgi:hypothetical protein
MTAREQLHRLVDQIEEIDIEEALRYLGALVTTTSNGGADRTRQVGGVDVPDRETLRRLARPIEADDPLWDLVGIVGDEYEGPTDVSSNKYKYLAEAYADLGKE